MQVFCKGFARIKTLGNFIHLEFEIMTSLFHRGNMDNCTSLKSTVLLQIGRFLHSHMRTLPKYKTGLFCVFIEQC